MQICLFVGLRIYLRQNSLMFPDKTEQVAGGQQAGGKTIFSMIISMMIMVVGAWELQLVFFFQREAYGVGHDGEVISNVKISEFLYQLFYVVYTGKYA